MKELKLYLVTDSDILKGRDFYNCIEEALKGDSKDIAMTIMPCTWSYYYIGKHLYETYKDRLEENFYVPWIKEYASEEFRQCTEEWIDYIDEICENISEDEKERLKDIFIKSSLYEMEFWNMANK